MFLVRVILICVLALFLCCKNANANENFFTFDELVELSKKQEVDKTLTHKLNQILYSPVVDNTIAPSHPKLNNDEILGDFIRVASWNIARGRNFDKIKLVFENPGKLSSEIKVKEQAEILKNADILVLNEVDIGMPRTGYKNIAEELARTLKFN
jgi:hypothetical protein